ncbi:MAG: DNA/RNA nuclease SfsA [Anaerolineae bacterium]|nr:DNA/RNA nuclease SfsA [Anaerolineae bacterium]
MRWPQPLVPAHFLRRENRFRCQVELDGAVVPAHLPNSGRLGELLTPGAAVRVRPAANPGPRKTVGDLTLVWHAGAWVSVDARLPGRLAAEALALGRLAPFAGYPKVQAEVRAGDSRLDLLLEGPAGRCWIETKSVTLVEGGVALFPDAPTARGARHLQALQALRGLGERAAVVFVVQRQDVLAFSPHPSADPAFAEALRRASRAGVEVYAYRCAVDLAGIEITEPVEVRL